MPGGGWEQWLRSESRQWWGASASRGLEGTGPFCAAALVASGAQHKQSLLRQAPAPSAPLPTGPHHPGLLCTLCVRR